MKKKVNRIAALLASAALLFGALSCSSDSGGGGGSDTGNNPTSSTSVAIVLTAEPATVTVGETITVKSNIDDVKFTSTDTTVATVDESTGVVKGVKAGTVEIIATKDATSSYSYTTGKIDIKVEAATTEYTIDGKTVVISDDGVSKTATITTAAADGTTSTVTATVTESEDGKTVTIADSEGNTLYTASTNADGTIDTSTVKDKDGNAVTAKEKEDDESLAGSIFTADFSEEDDTYSISIKDGVVLSFTSATGGTLYSATPDESLKNWEYEKDSFTYTKSGNSVVITYSYTDEEEGEVTEVLNGTLSSDGNTLSVISAEPDEDEEAVVMTKASAVPENPVATLTYYKATVVPVVDGTAGTGSEVELASLSYAVSTLVGENSLIGTYSDSSYSTEVSLSDVKAGDTIYVVYITQNQYLNGKGNDSWNKVDFDFSSYSNISSISIALTSVKGKGTDSDGWWFCYGASAWIGNLAWSDSISGYSATETDSTRISSIVNNGLYVYGNVFGSGNIAVTVTEKVPVTSVTISGDTTTVKEGLTITLKATVLPENATDSTVTWASSNETVATVDGGVVKGVKAGEAKITATADGVTSDAYTVTVEANNATLKSITKKSDPTKLDYNVGDVIDLTGLVFTLTYDDGTTGDVSYSSTDADAFVVRGFDSSKAAESQSVTVTYAKDGVTGTATFTVKIVQPVTGITVSGDSSVEVASSITLTASVEPTDATDGTVTWSSSNTDVATVDSTGKVTGVKEGTATITATANDGSGVAGSKTITVTAQTGDFVITIE